MEKHTLYIPQGIKLRSEIFEGFSKIELYKTIIVSIVAGIIMSVLFLLTQTVSLCLVLFLSVIFATVMVLTKDKNNVSVVDQLGFMVRFAKSQKIYKYKYLDEWNC